jgi:hypothetical protein
MTKSEKTQFHFNSIEAGDEDKCRTLWLSVILQQILDAKGKSGNAATQAQALAWLEGRQGIHSGLYEVCAYAGIDFKKAKKRVIELLKDDAQDINFRSKMRDKEHNNTAKNRRRYYRRIEKCAELRRQRQELEGFLSPKAANDNFPEPQNDNSEDSNGHPSNQPTEQN